MCARRSPEPRAQNPEPTHWHRHRRRHRRAGVSPVPKLLMSVAGRIVWYDALCLATRGSRRAGVLKPSPAHMAGREITIFIRRGYMWHGPSWSSVVAVSWPAQP